jgi:glycine/D-amino acid oxidase-like deaminating enzyme
MSKKSAIVIGAGIVGLATARALAMKGKKPRYLSLPGEENVIGYL